MLACGLAWGTEGFDSLPGGGLTSASVEYGQLSAAAGHAEIHGKGRSGGKSLRLLGGTDKTVVLKLNEALKGETGFVCWMERWTKKAPFGVSVVAVTPTGEQKVLSLDKAGTGGFHNKLSGKLPAGTTSVKFISTTPDGSGVMLDDLMLMVGKMKVNEVSVHHPGVWPVMKRAAFNPAVRLFVQTEGGEDAQVVESVEVTLKDPAQVEKVTLRSGEANGANFKNSIVYGSAAPDAEGKVLIQSTTALQGGENHLWLDIQPSKKSIIGSTVTVSDVKLNIGGQSYEPEMEPVSQRIGIMLAFPGDSVGNQPAGAEARPCAAFRIPGLIKTKKGTLIGCFDARYENEVDLCRDIDVAVVRSEDGGQTWSLPDVAMDSGPGMANGCGDPCILQDKKGRVWMQALACHFAPGARAINASGTGTARDKTGQWEMVCSDDEGKTWSSIVNATEQVKKDEWTLILAGPGNGICTKKGVLVFPAQIWQNGADPVCRSTICYSTDGGTTWKMGNGVPGKTSECQVVELEDGSLMLNCRNEAYGGRRCVYVTGDFGETWQEHETHCKALSEPTCQASLVSVKTEKYGRLLLFSNPKIHGRSNMTIRASRDDGKTWNEGVLYDVRGCMGYSCIALTDSEHVGIIYETYHTNGETDYRGIGFIRLPLETVVTGEEVEVKSAAAVSTSAKKAKKGKKKKKSRKKA